MSQNKERIRYVLMSELRTSRLKQRNELVEKTNKNQRKVKLKLNFPNFPSVFFLCIHSLEFVAVPSLTVNQSIPPSSISARKMNETNNYLFPPTLLKQETEEEGG